MTCVIDASALLAAILGERGGDDVAPMLDSAAVSTVTYHEVLVRLDELDHRHGSGYALVARQALRLIESRLTFVDFDMEAACVAAGLRGSTRHLGLSLGDRACLATAKKLALTVLTADGRMAEADLGIDIRLIR